MDEGEYAVWQKLATDADRKVAMHQPNAAQLDTIHRALDKAPKALGGEDVGKHRISFLPARWQPADVSLPSAVMVAERSGGKTASMCQPALDTSGRLAAVLHIVRLRIRPRRLRPEPVHDDYQLDPIVLPVRRHR
jgi:hypothetical protein